MARTALSSRPHDSNSSPANRGNIERPEAAEGDDARVWPESGGPGGNEASPDPHTEVAHNRAHPPAFEIGIVMAGAISAGAYTAGVMDFLIQALDAWQMMKDAGKDVDCPRHDVKLKVISGASAGGMTAALATGMLCEDFEHVVSDQVEEAANNKLFESWVRKIDIRRLLEARDLDDPGRPVRSVLDSSVLDEIAADAFEFRDVGSAPPDRPYLNDPLHVVLTLTNLRGVPYKIDLKGTRVTNYQMRLHADRLHFVLRLRRRTVAALLRAALAGEAQVSPARLVDPQGGGSGDGGIPVRARSPHPPPPGARICGPAVVDPGAVLDQRGPLLQRDVRDPAVLARCDARRLRLPLRGRGRDRQRAARARPPAPGRRGVAQPA